MDIITGYDLEEYFLNRVERIRQNNFYKVVKPIFVFKKVYTNRNTRAIANLIILPGSVIYNPNLSGDGKISDRKLRADKAYVHSVVSVNARKQCEMGVSFHNASFKYTPNTFVTPRYPFSYMDACCASGIHFFLNLQDALDY